MDNLSTIQNQITNQLVRINATLENSPLPAGVAATLSGSAATLQMYLDKLLLGSPLSTAEQQDLQNGLNTSQQAILAAQAKKDQMLLFAGVGVSVVIFIAILLIRQRVKRKKA